MWQSLFANLAVVAIVTVAWNALGDVVNRFGRTSQDLLFGAVMAAGTVGSLMMAYQPSSGIFYDLRGPLLAVSSFFGGPVAALVTVASALAYRFYMGGGSVLIGAFSIVIAAVIGLVGHARHRLRSMAYFDLIALAAAVTLSNALIGGLRVYQGQGVVLANLSTSLVLTFVGTLLVASLLFQEQRRRELAKSNLLYRSMVDALPDCLNIKDTEGRFLAANPATVRLMKAVAPAELLGKTDFDFYAPEIAARYRDDELSVLRTGEAMTIEQETRSRDGVSGWLSTMKVPVRDEDGRLIGLITHNRDISNAKSLQQKLAAAQEQLDDALENMNEGLAMYDQDGIFLFCNRRYRELFPQTSYLRVPGMSFADIVRASIESGEERLVQGRTLKSHIASKMAALHEDGERLIELVDGRRLSSRTKIVGNGCVLMIVSDVTERWRYQRQLEHLALHDPLTGLPNRAFFNRELGRLIERARESDTQLVVMLVDLDRFKEVNDTFGHPAGDALLVEIAQRLQKVMRRGDFVARLGGDEFAILISEPTADIAEMGLPERLSKVLAQPIKFGDVTHLPGGTIGYTVFPHDPSDADGLLKNADRALYLAKSRRRGSWAAYDPTASQNPGSSKAG
ncbi:diguanylate cyclase [Mesorhizobium sp. BAC0120]|uniref:diguanylate cyclase domain-containing protein n=1 Tax=Mesorhizobium sp. BAC0120 TaxID=3090670 RepID=UPI00298C13E4|nr:diguanylate cyclase [Mesorhizobium sp. BAC0120]MDW6026183.1 diguanylate cyclase [Mesorhizobium sp. BAC0120]